MQKSSKHMTAEELNVYIKYAKQFNIKDFCASTLDYTKDYTNIQLDKLSHSTKKTTSRKKSSAKKINKYLK